MNANEASPFMNVEAKSAFPGRQMDRALETELVQAAKEGSKAALERLIRIHQPWVFNIVLRMVEDYHDAEDLSQEIILKSFLHIDSFNGVSRFSTWLYRITVNHVLAMKKTNAELQREKYRKSADHPNKKPVLAEEDAESEDFIDVKNIPHDLSVLADELMIKCTLGMLLCLKRKQRIVYILGHVMAVNSKAAGEILDMKPDNFRKMLSRARERIHNFMHDRCSLVNPACGCTCERVLPRSVKNGYIDPLTLHFTSGNAPLVRDIAIDAKERMVSHVAMPSHDLFRAHPFQESPDFSRKVLEILASSGVQALVGMGVHSG